MPFSKEAMEFIQANEAADAAGNPHISREHADRMQSEADNNAFLDSPEGAEARRIWDSSNDESEFADILYADDDEEDAKRERDPSLDPALLEDRTMETYRAMEKRDAARWERQQAEKK